MVLKMEITIPPELVKKHNVEEGDILECSVRGKTLFVTQHYKPKKISKVLKKIELNFIIE